MENWLNLMSKTAQENAGQCMSCASPLVPHFLAPLYSSSVLSLFQQKKRCHEVITMPESFLLDYLSFVTSMATHFVSRVKVA